MGVLVLADLGQCWGKSQAKLPVPLWETISSIQTFRPLIIVKTFSLCHKFIFLYTTPKKIPVSTFFFTLCHQLPFTLPLSLSLPYIWILSKQLRAQPFFFCVFFTPSPFVSPSFHTDTHTTFSLFVTAFHCLSLTHTNTFTQTSLHCWGNESICTARCALSGAFDPRQRSALCFATGDTATKVLQTFIFSSFHCAATAVTLVSCHGLGRRDALSCCHFTVIVLSYTDLLNFCKNSCWRLPIWLLQR